MQAGAKFNLTRRQHRVRKALDSVAVQSCLVIMLLIDLCLLIVDVSAGAHAIVSVYSIVLVSVLSVELVVRIYAYGGYFVKDVMNIADLIVVVGSVLVLVLFDSQTASIVNLGRMARAVRSGWQTLLIVVKVRNRHTRTRMCVYVCVCVCVCVHVNVDRRHNQSAEDIINSVHRMCTFREVTKTRCSPPPPRELSTFRACQRKSTPHARLGSR